MDHIWWAPSRLKKNQRLLFLEELAIIFGPLIWKTLYILLTSETVSPYFQFSLLWYIIRVWSIWQHSAFLRISHSRVYFSLIFLFSGPSLGPSDSRAEERGEAEEDWVHPDPDRVRAHSLRDPHGRHPLQEIQTQQGNLCSLICCQPLLGLELSLKLRGLGPAEDHQMDFINMAKRFWRWGKLSRCCQPHPHSSWKCSFPPRLLSAT